MNAKNRRRVCFGIAAATVVALPAWAAQPQAETKPVKAPERPYTELPYTPSLDLNSIDKSADPCVDFYQYSCGGWIQHNPIPPDRARWSVYGKLAQDNQQFLWGILEQAAAAKKRSADEQKIGDYFAACMDEGALEKQGDAALKQDLAKVDALQSVQQLPSLLGALHLTMADPGLLFGVSSGQDYANSSKVIAFAYAGGLGLPDRDYYTKTDARSVELRKKYEAHVARTFGLLGESAQDAAAHAQQVLAFETELAKASLTRVEKRDPHNLDHKLSRKELSALTPHFDWNAYLKAVGIPKVAAVNVTEPKFYQEVDAKLAATPLPELKTYLRWQLARARSPYLSRPFVDASFDFFQKTLRGVAEQPPRWKKCVQWVDRDLGEALGKAFVKKAFGPKLKADTVHMTKLIEDAMKQDIDSLGWMSPETKKHALEKLASIRNKVGYPEKWRDYSALKISRADFAEDVLRATAFESRRQLAKIGKPLDRGEWQMTPPTVNAYYDPQMNDINFPAGVLQPPLYDAKMDDAPNYGNTGSTIGHELTHGFDDEGRQFDAHGNLKDWWSAKDAAEFQKRASCVSDESSQYVIIDDIHINGKLTLGEDVADLGGTILAYNAWKKAEAQKKLGGLMKTRTPPNLDAPIDGYTPDQRFFIGLAQWACESERPENARVSAITNPHSPGRYRINGVVANLPEFWKAFGCKQGQPMVHAPACRVW